MAKVFWSDQDGFTVNDYEKLTTGILFTLTVLVVLYKYITKNTVDVNMVYLATGLGGLFIAGKAVERHYDTKVITSTPVKQEPTGTI